jgi:DNA invertase Pin-like site-specific DNA recombinase
MREQKIMSKRKQKQIILTPGWAIYLRTSSKDTQNPKNSQERQRQAIYANVISKNSMPVYAEYADTETGLNPHRTNYQKMLHDARLGKFSHIVAENTERFGRNDTESLRAMDEMATLGVQVRFADYPDLDPMDSDERIVIVLTAALARRESDKISERTIGGLQTSARTGGYIGRAPDGYINREKTVSVHQSDNQGRRVTWIEPDPKQAQVWREAWQLLLENRYTLREICEILHQRGHTFKTGRPFVKSAPKGKRTHATNDLSRIFRNPVYAGWVNNLEYVKPMTVDGNWEAIIDRQDFLRGLEILECRSRKRHTKRKHFYLLLRIAYVQTEGHITRLSGSTPNVNRTTKGNPYYCLPSSNINIPCTIVDNNVRQLLATLNIEKALQAQLRSIFREEIRQTLAYSTGGFCNPTRTLYTKTT